MMELKEVISLIKEYLSLCKKLYIEDYPKGFVCCDIDFPKLSPAIMTCIKHFLDSTTTTWITFTDKTFLLDLNDYTVDLLDSSDWEPEIRDFLNNFAPDILILRNEWRRCEEHKYINKRRKKEEKTKESLYKNIDEWLKENYTKETQEKLIALRFFWDMRGRMVYNSEDIELTKISFEEVLENHPEYLE